MNAAHRLVDRATRGAWMLLTAVVLLGGIPRILHSQERFQTFPLPQSPLDSFYRWHSNSQSLWFADSVQGFGTWTQRAGATGGRTGWYRTSDAGLSWRYVGSLDSIPSSIEVRGGYGFGGSPLSKISITRDSGRSWQRVKAGADTLFNLTYDTLPPNSLPAVQWALSATASQHLRLTTNGGASWMLADTLVPGLDSASFATYREHQWERLLAVRGGTLFALSRYRDTTGTGSGLLLWRIDQRTRRAEVDTLRETLVVFNKSRLSVVSAHVLIATTADRRGLVVSRDGGRTWETKPAMTDLQGDPVVLHGLQSPTDGFWISTTHWTRDTGRTWHRWKTRFDTPRIIAAPDSLHIYGEVEAGDRYHYSIFVGSGDGGRAWQSSGVRPWPSAAGADSGRVLVGDRFGRMWRSLDSGQRFGSVSLPPEVSHILQLVRPDPSRPARWLAMAECMDLDLAPVCMLESLDTGATWRVVGETSARPPMQFVPRIAGSGVTGYSASPAGGFYRSDDEGVSWQKISDDTLNAFAMGDERTGVAERWPNVRRTTDGGHTWTSSMQIEPGRWSAIGVHAFSADTYAYLLPDQYQRSGRWYIQFSSDSGRTWERKLARSTLEGMVGDVYWLSRSQVYWLPNNYIYYSDDTARSFESMLGRGFRAVAIAHDSRYFYLLNEDSVGRWRIDERISSVPRATPDRADRAGRIDILQNPVRGDEAVICVTVTGERDIRISLFDLHGEIVRDLDHHVTDADGCVRVDVAGLPAGRYLVRAMTGENALVAFLAVVR